MYASETVVNAVVGFGFGSYLFYKGIAAWRLKRYIQNIPLSKINAVAMGDAEIAGEIQPLMLVKTRFSQRDCVYCYYTIERRHKNDWEIESKGEVTSIFTVNDGTGEILLNPTGATYYGPYTYQDVGLDGRRHTEYALTPQQIVFVEGRVSTVRRVVDHKEREDMIIGMRDSGEFVLSAFSEERLVGQFGWKSPLQIFGGAAMALACLWFIISQLTWAGFDY